MANCGNFAPISLVSDTAPITLSVAGTYRGGLYSRQTPATPPGYDPGTERVFVGSVDRSAIDVLDISKPCAPHKEFEIDLTPYGGEPNSVAVYKGVVAAVVKDPQRPGVSEKIVFFNANGDLLADPVNIEGASRIAFTPNGRKLVVTIGAGPRIIGFDPETGLPIVEDPEGAVAVIDLNRLNRGGCTMDPERCHLDPSVRIAAFTKFNAIEDELIASGVRIYGPDIPTDPDYPTAAQDLDPSALSVSADSRFAYVTLERNNAIAVVDLRKVEVVDLFALGTKDHSRKGSGFDASDKDGINIRSWPVQSFYSPDGIAAVGHGRNIYLITANEGDPKNFQPFYTEEAEVKDLALDDQAFPNAAELKKDVAVGRLIVTNEHGDTDGDGDYDELYMLGSRSFSVWSRDGDLVFDSGDDFEQITAQAAPTLFNAPEDANRPDARSVSRGPEPEHLTTGKIGGHEYVFIGFERIGGIIVYDVTDPKTPEFVQYINNRNPAVDPSDVCGAKGEPEKPGCALAGDLEPEGLLFIPERDSPVDAPLLVAIHELSDSTTIYRIDANLPTAGGEFDLLLA
jgi:hypothetical protein